jgi:hypothetical protein
MQPKREPDERAPRTNEPNQEAPLDQSTHPRSPAQEAAALTGEQKAEQARRLRQRFSWLTGFTDQELEQISFCLPGSEMVPGETYFDISYPEQGPFVGEPGQLIPQGGCLVPKSQLRPNVWDKLIRFP